MPIITKYESVLSLMKELKVKDLNAYEDGGKLWIKGIIHSEDEKKLIISRLAQVNVEEASDVELDLRIEGQG